MNAIRKFAIILVLFFPALLCAQTTVSGTIVDANANPYLNGTVSAYFLPSTGQGAPFTVNSTTNSAGTFSIFLKSTGAYQFTVCAMPVNIGPLANPTPTQICTYSSPIQISGPTQDVSTQINANAPLLGPRSGSTGGGSLPVAVSAGQLPSATGAGTTYVAQTKAVIDVRDRGVDCTGTSDSSTALNLIFASLNQVEVDFPLGCQVRVDSPVVIQSQSAWVLRGLGNLPGVGGFGGPSIYGCNGVSGPVLYINRSGFGRIEGLGIYPKGPTGVCAASSFTQSIQIDSTGNPGVTTHNITLNNVALTTSPAGTAITNYIGVNITDGGKQNGEMIKVLNSWIHCQNSSNSIGIANTNPTSDNDLAESNNIVACRIGIWNNGNIRVLNNLFSSVGNNSVFGAFGANIYTPACSSGQMDIFFNEEDSGGPFIDNGHDQIASCASGLNVVGNQIGVSDIASGEYVIDVGNSGAAGWQFIGNTFLVTQATNQYLVGNNVVANKGGLAAIFDLGNNLRAPTGSNTLGFSDPSTPFQYGEYHFTFNFLGITGPNNNPADASSVSHTWFPVRATGSTFREQSPFLGLRSQSAGGNSPDDWRWQTISDNGQSAITYNHSGNAPIAWWNYDGQTNGIKFAQVTNPAAPTGVTPTGTPGSTVYTYALVAFGSTGNTAGSPTLSTGTGNASLSGTNYNLVQFVPTASIGATNWCVWRTAGGVTQGKIGCVPAVGTVNNTQNADTYFFKDTGLTGDGSALPAINTTGRILTAITGLTQCLHVDTNGAVSGTGSDCGAGGGGLSGLVTFGFLYAANSTTAVSTTPGTNQGTYTSVRNNTVHGTAAAITEAQVGDCALPGTITGAATTYTVLYTDILCNVSHDIAGSQSATITIPTPATLDNPAPIFSYSNYSTHDDTLTPTTYTISAGNVAAGANITAKAGFSCKVQLDPTNASTWKADCHQMQTSTSISFSGNTSASTSAGAGVSSAVVGNPIVADGSGNVIPQVGTTTVGVGGVNGWGLPIWENDSVGNGTPVNNTLYVHQVRIAGLPQTIGHATFNVVTGGTSETMYVCVYNVSGSTLLWSAAGAVNTSATVVSSTAAQVTLQPGYYLFAYGQTGTASAVVTADGSIGTPTWINVLNQNGVRVGTAANNVSSGCPATTGALGASTGTGAAMKFMLEP